MHDLRHFLDGISFMTTIGALAGFLPPLAALISILWIAYQFYHSAPMKAWRDQRRRRK